MYDVIMTVLPRKVVEPVRYFFHFGTLTVMLCNDANSPDNSDTPIKLYEHYKQSNCRQYISRDIW